MSERENCWNITIPLSTAVIARAIHSINNIIVHSLQVHIVGFIHSAREHNTCMCMYVLHMSTWSEDGERYISELNVVYVLQVISVQAKMLKISQSGVILWMVSLHVKSGTRSSVVC